MSSFAINNPGARYYLQEYVISEWWRSLGGVSVRYDFVDVFINGEYKGVYLLEEDAEKRAVEHSKKREAPILKDDHVYSLETAILASRGINTNGVAKQDTESDYSLIPKKLSAHLNLKYAYSVNQGSFR
ncbi:MAG: CotH kinase family protein [Clostridiales bacterium]|jgi:hypothetical protein|nr:CotH kinase family protein [Clostridiales bacterium]